MHCEKRVGIKILTILFIEGLYNYQGGNFCDLLNVHRNSQRELIYIVKIEKNIRVTVLYSYGNGSQCSMPVGRQSNVEETVTKIGTISMENYKVRKCMEHIDEIINMLVLYKNRLFLMKLTISHYKDSMIIMRKKDGYYTDQDLTTYHAHASDFSVLD